jgi:excisionase family DNA binding protein
MQKEKSKRWLKAVEAAEFLGVHIHTIYNNVARGLLPFTHRPGIGLRIDREALEKLMEDEVKARLKAGAQVKPKPETQPQSEAK